MQGFIVYDSAHLQGDITRRCALDQAETSCTRAEQPPRKKHSVCPNLFPVRAWLQSKLPTIHHFLGLVDGVIDLLLEGLHLGIKLFLRVLEFSLCLLVPWIELDSNLEALNGLFHLIGA